MRGILVPCGFVGAGDVVARCIGCAGVEESFPGSVHDDGRSFVTGTEIEGYNFITILLLEDRRGKEYD